MGALAAPCGQLRVPRPRAPGHPGHPAASPSSPGNSRKQPRLACGRRGPETVSAPDSHAVARPGAISPLEQHERTCPCARPSAAAGKRAGATCAAAAPQRARPRASQEAIQPSRLFPRTGPRRGRTRRGWQVPRTEGPPCKRLTTTPSACVPRPGGSPGVSSLLLRPVAVCPRLPGWAGFAPALLAAPPLPVSSRPGETQLPPAPSRSSLRCPHGAESAVGFTPWARGSVQRLCARPSSSSEGTRHFWLRPALPRARVSRQRDCGPGGRDFREAFLKQEAQPFPAFVSLARNVAVMTGMGTSISHREVEVC